MGAKKNPQHVTAFLEGCANQAAGEKAKRKPFNYSGSMLELDVSVRARLMHGDLAMSAGFDGMDPLRKRHPRTWPKFHLLMVEQFATLAATMEQWTRLCDCAVRLFETDREGFLQMDAEDVVERLRDMLTSHEDSWKWSR